MGDGDGAEVSVLAVVLDEVDGEALCLFSPAVDEVSEDADDSASVLGCSTTLCKVSPFSIDGLRCISSMVEG
jgi:hypothetical protein